MISKVIIEAKTNLLKKTKYQINNKYCIILVKIIEHIVNWIFIYKY